MSHGKKYRQVVEKLEEGKVFAFAEAIQFLKENKLASFDESVEFHVHLAINTKKSEGVRGSVVLPHGTGKTKKIAVVSGTKEKEAKDAGAAVVGGEDLITKIKEGKVVPGTDFEVVLATPDMMPKLAQIAKILGPKGMMPSPKNETVTQKIGETVEMLAGGKKVNYKNDDTGNIHQIVGKLSFAPEALLENLTILVDSIEKGKPEGFKGKFIASMTLSTTMGPGLKIVKSQ